VRTRTAKFCGKSSRGFLQAVPKRVFLSPIPCGLLDTYSAPISTVFETADMNRCAGVCILEKFWNFCIGGLQAPKNCPQKRYFRWSACYQCTAQTAQFQAIVIILGAGRRPKDVPFIREFWWWMYGLGGTTPKLGLPPFHFPNPGWGFGDRTPSRRGQHSLFEPILQWVVRSTATPLVWYFFYRSQWRSHTSGVTGVRTSCQVNTPKNRRLQLR